MIGTIISRIGCYRYTRLIIHPCSNILETEIFTVKILFVTNVSEKDLSPLKLLVASKYRFVILKINLSPGFTLSNSKSGLIPATLRMATHPCDFAIMVVSGMINRKRMVAFIKNNFLASSPSSFYIIHVFVVLLYIRLQRRGVEQTTHIMLIQPPNG